MDYMGIAFIIITVVICVHIVYERGKKEGQYEGRMQILQENLKKAEFAQKKSDLKLVSKMIDEVS